MKLLIVEDDQAIRKQLRWALQEEFPVILDAWDEQSAAKELGAMEAGIVLLDLHLPPCPDSPEAGLRLLELISGKMEELTVIVLSGTGDALAPRMALKLGAWDFLSKPVDPELLLLLLKRAAERATLLGRLAEKGPDIKLFHGMAGESRAMENLFDWLERAAPSGFPVLIQGESGTGKERAAVAVHKMSPRSGGPFVAVNCGAVPENLFESEFFGFRKGAFTGADRNSDGLLKQSHGGTLFLDEITLLSSPSQAKLLRFLEDGEFRPLGGSHPEQADVRLISATNSDMETELKEGSFREDLYYRIAALKCSVPPLRERAEDIPILFRLFMGKEGPVFSKEAWDAIESHPWPGNVRELKHMAQRLSVMVRNRAVLVEDLDLPKSRFTFSAQGHEPEPGPWATCVAEFETRLLKLALEKAGGDRKHAAEALCLAPNQFRYLCRKYGI